ncbi:MAG: hypothetical protein LWY06_16045 [Firmicutes bacterium]|nr:hypothetical protein [Bacillota bacterium]
MRKHIALIAVISFILITAAASWADAVTDDFAQGFLKALKSRNIPEARKFCDFTISVDPDGDYNGGQFAGINDLDFLRKFATYTCDSWVASVDSKKLAWYKDRRLNSVKGYFGDMPCFVIGDSNNKLAGLDQDYVKSNFGGTVKAAGWIVFVHKVQGKWLVYRVVPGGVIIE